MQMWVSTSVCSFSPVPPPPEGRGQCDSSLHQPGTYPRGKGGDGAPGAGISMGPILKPCLPRSLALQRLQLSCPPAPPQRPSHHCRCPRCVSVPPSPTVGGGEPLSVPALPLASLRNLRRGMTPHWAATSPCNVSSVTVGGRARGDTVSPACSTRHGPE